VLNQSPGDTLEIDNRFEAFYFVAGHLRDREATEQDKSKMEETS